MSLAVSSPLILFMWRRRSDLLVKPWGTPRLSCAVPMPPAQIHIAPLRVNAILKLSGCQSVLSMCTDA